MEKIIASREELVALLKPGRRVQFRFCFPGFDDFFNQRWEQEIQRYYNACGCGTGAAFAITATALNVGYLGYLIFFRHVVPPLSDVIAGIVFIFIATGMGKIVGKAFARVTLKKKIETLSVLL